MLSIDLDIGNIVLENGWDVDLCSRAISHVMPRMHYPKLSWKAVDEAARRGQCRCRGRGRAGSSLTSGNVPLEKTLCQSQSFYRCHDRGSIPYINKQVFPQLDGAQESQ